MQLLRVLGAFQLLEFALKLYISTAYAVIKQSLDGSVHFGYAYKDIQRFPLEKLMNVFTKLNDNIELQSRINKLRDKRNDIAHGALLYRHDLIRDLLALDVEAHVVDLSKTEQEVDECLSLVTRELEPLISKYRINAA
ncbi:hypothetical protein ASD22_02830 [Rhodanobacter sp. Root480]|nr:hypothetical protein ASD22_02830 [Rhodanobacter sp. Root480]